jgi:hypothetical protein
MMNFIKIFLPFFLITVSFPQNSDESWKLYDDAEVARIDITIDPNALDWIYENFLSDSLHYASFHFKNQHIDESVDSIGFRIRGNTSRGSDKKSFKVSFNTFVGGREFYGVDKMNLNGEHNDPSIVRSKLSWDLFKEIGLISSRASFVELYINGDYYGLYISVEHVDDEFLEKNFSDDAGNLWKCLFPADLAYLGSDPDLYKLTENNRPVYELKTNEDEDDYSQLARLINIINNTPANQFQDSIEKILNVQDVLKYFAMNILTGSWDDYWSLRNNYYLYHEPSADKFQLIPYDYDNTFGIDWFNINWAVADPYNFPKVNQGARPLVEKLMSVPQYRNLYTLFLEFYRENILKLSAWESRIDNFKNMLAPFAETDTFRTKDYGFTMNDFHNSYSTSFQNQHVKRGIKEFINIRYNSLASQLNYTAAAPHVYQIDWSPKNPLPTDSIYVTISAFSNAGITEAQIRFIPEGSPGFEQYDMHFSPVENTKKVEEADRWIGVIPPMGINQSGSFKIYVKDSNQLSSVYPKGDPFVIQASQAIEGLFINEIMASNSVSFQDPFGEYDDWFEIYNSTYETIVLSGMFLTDKPDNLTKWQFPDNNIVINPGEFLVIWCDEDQEQGDLHTNFKISADGEYLAITAPDGFSIIDSITFGPIGTDSVLACIPDGTENWYKTALSTPGRSNLILNIDDEMIPLAYSLTAYPNPFNPSTIIRFTLTQKQQVKLSVFDILGKEIEVLLKGEKEAGIHEVNFDAMNLSSGLYFYRIETPNFNETKKLILLK